MNLHRAEQGHESNRLRYSLACGQEEGEAEKLLVPAASRFCASLLPFVYTATLGCESPPRIPHTPRKPPGPIPTPNTHNSVKTQRAATEKNVGCHQRRPRRRLRPHGWRARRPKVQLTRGDHPALPVPRDEEGRRGDRGRRRRPHRRRPGGAGGPAQEQRRGRLGPDQGRGGKRYQG